MGSPCIAPPSSVQSSSSTFCSDGLGSSSSSSASSSLPLQSCSLRGRKAGLLSAAAWDYSTSRHAQSIQRPVLRRAQQQQEEQQELQNVTVEDEGVAVEGVIRVDKELSARPSWGRAIALAGGDLVALLAFASIGRLSHGMPAFNWEVVRTADPFIAGWLLGAYFIGGFGPEGQGLYGLRTAAVSGFKSWAIGIPLALAIRSFTTGHTPAQAFILVSLGSTLVLLVGWRTVFTAFFPNEDTSSLKDGGGDRKGSVFEFLELLTSLVRRW